MSSHHFKRYTGDLGPRRGWRRAVVAAVVLALAACSGEVEEPVVFVEPTGPWAEEIAAAQQDASSEFEQRVLADAVVTREEYEEEHQLWLMCMEDAIPPDTGFTIALEEDAQGLYSTLVNIPAGMESAFENVNYDAISRECSQGTLDLVTALYADITRFPTRSYEEGVVACLTEIGLVEPWYSVENFEADWARSNPDAGLPWDSALVTDLDLGDPGVFTCL